ncbi:hypothetical protein H7U12_09215 [Rufibacter sp. H-1]|uniref:Uncharacterized protein n=2 Tax=Rufibacter sediminis TaxID=2762756 RepID=A0ABR6VRT1_9BACT|nr:hypothetical protein [Rufibacter sediminis]MBC3539861.1 hypothetical protein [Rufibacter sediminis]
MIQRWFCWLLLACFSIHAGFGIKAAEDAGEPLGFVWASPTGSPESVKGTAPLLLILEGYLDLLEDVPRVEYNFRSFVKVSCKAAVKVPVQAQGLRLPHLLHTSLAYLPQRFVLSEYHGFIFRLTPF